MSLLVTSCASIGNYFTKKSCKSANWFEEGKSIALSGQRVDSSKKYNQCKSKGFFVNHADVDMGFKAGVKIYCSPNEAYKRGRNAKPNPSVKDFCEPNLVNKILSQYQRGVNDFCQKSAAYKYAVAGKVYPVGFCPQKLERNFLTGYNKGRITFLKSEVIKSESRYKSIDTDIARLQQKKNEYVRDMAYLPRNSTASKSTSYNAETGEYETRTFYNDGAGDRYNELDGKVKSLEREINDLVDEKGTLNKNTAKYKQEIMTLENQVL